MFSIGIGYVSFVRVCYEYMFDKKKTYFRDISFIFFYLKGICNGIYDKKRCCCIYVYVLSALHYDIFILTNILIKYRNKNIYEYFHPRSNHFFYNGNLFRIF